MKRAKDFAVVIGQSEFDQEQADQIISDAQRTSSWHKVWELVEEAFAKADSNREALVVDVESKELIARFSSEDLQVYASESGESIYDEEDETGSPANWDSVPFDIAGSSTICFANRNILDYEWHLLDGATHEVPFRLSYLERKAELNPNGIVARWHRLLLEWRDMFSPHAVS